MVTAFDGDTITIRQFNGPKLRAAVQDACEDVTAGDSSLGDEESSDEGFGPAEALDGGDGFEEPVADASTEEPESAVDLGDEDETASCDLADVSKGDVLTSADIETVDGETFVTAVELA